MAPSHIDKSMYTTKSYRLDEQQPHDVNLLSFFSGIGTRRDSDIPFFSIKGKRKERCTICVW